MTNSGGNERLTPLQMIITADDIATKRRRIATTVTAIPIGGIGAAITVDGLTNKYASQWLDVGMGPVHVQEWQAGIGALALGLLVFGLGRIPYGKHRREYRNEVLRKAPHR